MNNNLHISEVYVNKTEGHRFGESGIYETNTDDKGELFRDLQQEFGRCGGKVYRDTKEGTVSVGWVFEKKMVYEDSRSTEYIREVWVTLHEVEEENDG